MIADSRLSLSPPRASANPALSKGWPARQAPSLARETAHTAIAAQARKTARAMIKDSARGYALRPHELDTIIDALSTVHPIIAIGALKGLRVYQARYNMSFGGEVQAINLRGAMLYARYSRAKANQVARRSV